MANFDSYVSLPEGKYVVRMPYRFCRRKLVGTVKQQALQCETIRKETYYHQCFSGDH